MISLIIFSLKFWFIHLVRFKIWLINCFLKNRTNKLLNRKPKFFYKLVESNCTSNWTNQNFGSVRRVQNLRPNSTCHSHQHFLMEKVTLLVVWWNWPHLKYMLRIWNFKYFMCVYGIDRQVMSKYTGDKNNRLMLKKKYIYIGDK